MIRKNNFLVFFVNDILHNGISSSQLDFLQVAIRERNSYKIVEYTCSIPLNNDTL